MSKDYKVEEVKKERRGILSPDYRNTSRDTEGNIGVSKWEKTPADATKSSREALSPDKRAEKE